MFILLTCSNVYFVARLCPNNSHRTHFPINILTRLD